MKHYRINYYCVCILVLGFYISNVKARASIVSETLCLIDNQSNKIQKKNHQSVKKIMDNASSLFTNRGGVVIHFKMVNRNSESMIIASNKGILKMNHLKYMLRTEVSQSWYDGSTQWSYLVDTDEVNVLNPTNDELMESNPYLFIFSYKNLFNAKLLKTYHHPEWIKNSKSMDFVEFIPKLKDYPYQKIVLSIDKLSYEIKQMKCFSIDGNVISLTIEQFKTGIKYPAKTFQFEKKLLPNAEVIDLR